MLLTASTPAHGRRRAIRPSEPAHGFRAWRRDRPFVGALLLILAGIEIFCSTQLDLGNIRIQMGIEGFQAVLIPAGLVLLGVLSMLMPVHRLFYGVIALVVAVYSVIGVNLGGFFAGMLLGAIGGTVVVAWGPRRATATEEDDAVVHAATDEPVRAERAGAGAEPVVLDLSRIPILQREERVS